MVADFLLPVLRLHCQHSDRADRSRVFAQASVFVSFVFFCGLSARSMVGRRFVFVCGLGYISGAMALPAVAASRQILAGDF